MKPKKLWMVKPVIVLLIVTSVLLAGVSFFFDKRLFIAEIVLAAAVSIFAIVRLRMTQRDIYKFLQNMGERLNVTEREALHNFPMPVIVVSSNREIIWYNDMFRDKILGGEDAYGMSMDVLTDLPQDDFCSEQGVELHYNDQAYKVVGIKSGEEKQPLYMLYFSERTQLVKIAQEYEQSRPSVMLLMIDNYDELMQNAKESEKSRLLGEIDYILENFMGETTGFIRKLSHDKFIAVVEERHLRRMIESRFKILDEARAIVTDQSIPVTLSIGVGRGGKDLLESEHFARQGLDMALGRGGDQAAVKTAGGFDFFGGVSKGFEKRTKVKTRIIATALAELIESSDNVIVMGHRFGDLDCLGSAIALAQAIRRMGRPAVIAVNREKNLATALMDRMEEGEARSLFVPPNVAMELIQHKTLLIITDTHNPDILESQELYHKCPTVVVIDHHRKMVNFIDNAVIFYHEPYASSASEMVTELIQYFGDRELLTRFEAEALLSGIMLDTRNFVIRTGVRTFEAAAYLRRLGADTVSVRKLFSSSIDSYQRKTRLVASAEIYKGCAIVCSDMHADDIRLVAPQAADELLGISGVEASFVLYEIGGGANLSARSLGNMNVQVIMESLGGGGHQTMAGAQLEGVTPEKARQMLLDAIDRYYESRN